MNKWIILASIVTLTAFLGIAQAEDATKSLFNDKCPISGRDVDDSKTSDYKVEFCCNNCKGKFDKDPGKFMDKVAAGDEGKCIFNGRDAKTSSTLTVGFCCGGCKGKFDKAPKDYIGKVKPIAKTEE